MKEKETGKMVIEEVDEDTVYDMLTFIYGGKIGGMKDKAEKLLVVAERYDLKPLKEHCERLMAGGVTIENCLDYLVMADLHSALMLKSVVMEFVVENGEEVADKGEWKEILADHPKLLAEVCHYLLTV